MSELNPTPDLRIILSEDKCVDLLVESQFEVPFRMFFRKVLRYLKIDYENRKKVYLGLQDGTKLRSLQSLPKGAQIYLFKN